MFDKDQALGLLRTAAAELAQAHERLDEIRREEGEVKNLKQKRNAVRRPLEDAEAALSSLRQIIASAEVAPVVVETGPETESETETETAAVEPGAEEGATTDTGTTEGGAIDAGPTEAGETGTTEPVDPTPADDLFSLEDQHAVSKLMQDSAVHLATIRKRNFWEIRHRNTPDGRPSDPIRAETIAEAYEAYDRQAVRKSGFTPFEPRRLTPDEQRALADFHNMPIDNPRSVRWEATMTEVDYIDKDRRHAGGRSDDVQFPPGELVGPVEHLKTVLS